MFLPLFSWSATCISLSSTSGTSAPVSLSTLCTLKTRKEGMNRLPLLFGLNQGKNTQLCICVVRSVQRRWDESVHFGILHLSFFFFSIILHWLVLFPVNKTFLSYHIKVIQRTPELELELQLSFCYSYFLIMTVLSWLRVIYQLFFFALFLHSIFYSIFYSTNVINHCNKVMVLLMGEISYRAYQ